MKHTKEEILKALNVIRDECKEEDYCTFCPFADKDENCMLRKERPYAWTIKTETEEAWKAFEE